MTTIIVTILKNVVIPVNAKLLSAPLNNLTMLCSLISPLTGNGFHTILEQPVPIIML